MNSSLGTKSKLEGKKKKRVHILGEKDNPEELKGAVTEDQNSKIRDG